MTLQTQWGIFTTPRGALTKATSDPNLQNHWKFSVYIAAEMDRVTLQARPHTLASRWRADKRWRNGNEGQKHIPVITDETTTQQMQSMQQLNWGVRLCVSVKQAPVCPQQPAVPWKPSRRSWNGLFTSTWQAGALCRTAGESHAQKLCQGYWRT